MARIIALGISYARPSIPSKTLRNDLHGVILTDTTGELVVDYYWAVFVHNGRAPFSMPFGRYLVWFRNPKDDPRLDNGVSPRRVAQLRHLTAEQFRAGLLANKTAIAAGLEPPMVVRREIRTRTPAKPFFSNAPGGGMHGFTDHVQQETGAFVRGLIREQIGDDAISPISVVVRVRI